MKKSRILLFPSKASVLLGEKINSDVSISALSQLLCKHDKMLKAKQSETDKKGGGWGWEAGSDCRVQACAQTQKL